MTHRLVDRRSLPPILITLALFLGIAAAPTQAALVCTASDFSCPALPATCVIGGSHQVQHGCVLDFGAQSVRITGTWTAEVRSGSFTIVAGSLTLDGGKLRSPGDLDEWGGDISIVTPGAFVMEGSGPQIFTSGHGGGGYIDVSAGSISILAGNVLAEGGSGEENCGDAGDVSLVATGPVVIAGNASTVRSTTSGYPCSGGEVTIEGTTVDVQGGVTCTGGSPFGLTIEASEGDVIVTAVQGLACDGVGSQDESGNDAGSVDLAAEGDIEIAGPVSATGSGPDGGGGDVTLDASGGVEMTAAIEARGPGGDNSGGTIEISSLTGITADALLDASASNGDSGGGEVTLDSDGPITVTASATLDVDGAGFDAGSIAIATEADVVVAGQLLATANNGGTGGSIDVSGCRVTVSGLVDGRGAASGEAFDVQISGGQLDVLATAAIHATPCPGLDCLTLRVPSGAPGVAPGATLAPAPIVHVDPSFAPCCGNGVVDDGTAGTPSAGEQCDDGNFLLCDGCTASCQLEPACAPDGNECTLDCSPIQGCVYAPQTGTACTDEGDLCTDDVCQAGTCAHPPLACDDGIGCTIDSCEGGVGCVFTADDAACDDDESCTTDTCLAGSGCSHESAPDGTTCDDSSFCTLADSCQSGVCTGPPPYCDDGNPCTNDLCLPSIGCNNVEAPAACDCLDEQGAPEPEGTACALGDACTTGDTCDAFGACQPGAFCPDDGDACTIELCYFGICARVDTGCPGTGSCIDGFPCSDGDECTTGVCQDDVCVNDPIPCGDGDSCTGEEACLENIGCRQVGLPPVGDPQCTGALLDHFTCYVARKSPGATDVFTPLSNLALEDVFQSVSVDVKSVKYLCAPTSKAGEDPTAPSHEDHLEAYKVKPVAGSAPFERVKGVVVTNQLGTITLDVKKLDLLLVPSVKEHGEVPAPSTPPDPDHFACYVVAKTAGTAAFPAVPGLGIEDQFGGLTVDLKSPFRLCSPANANGADPQAPGHDAHLLCYKAVVTRNTPAFAPVSDLFVDNPFGLEELAVKRVQTLCVPSAVTIPAP